MTLILDQNTIKIDYFSPRLMDGFKSKSYLEDLNVVLTSVVKQKQIIYERHIDTLTPGKTEDNFKVTFANLAMEESLQ